MEKINPLLYITDWSPNIEAAMNASKWFESETMQVTIQPGSDVSIGWFQAQGWVVVKIDRSTGPGESATTTVRVSGDVSSSRSTTTVNRSNFVYTYTLKRKKLQADLVLQNMIEEFTKAYNEGRVLNDRRYDEIVMLYSVMLSRSEDEINIDTSDYEVLMRRILGNLEREFYAHEAKTEGLLVNLGDSRREQVNLRFDNEIASARQSLVSKGLYNTTVWASTSSGIERNREMALNDLEDKLAEREISVVDRLQTIRNEMNDRISSSAERIRGLVLKKAFDAATFRNTILTAMLAFMERRSDDYPGIGELANLAAGLGYGEGYSVKPG